MSAIFKTQGGGGGLFASIFVKGLSETDTVYATKDGVVRNGVWTERTDESGFLISRVKDFGMWTVTATNGVKTRTVDVLVDVATEFEIFMDLYKLWLYREGDECEEVTGGWVLSYGDAGQQSTTLTKNADSMYISYTSGAGAGKSGGCGTKNLIDLTEYSKCYAEVSGIGGTADYNFNLAASNTNTGDGTGYATESVKATPADGIMELDITSVSQAAIIRFTCQANKYGTIHNVWLE